MYSLMHALMYRNNHCNFLSTYDLLWSGKIKQQTIFVIVMISKCLVWTPPAFDDYLINLSKIKFRRIEQKSRNYFSDSSKYMPGAKILVGWKKWRIKNQWTSDNSMIFCTKCVYFDKHKCFFKNYQGADKKDYKLRFRYSKEESR